MPPPHAPLSPPSTQQPDSQGQRCHPTLGSQAPRALSADCVRNTSLLGRCDYFSNAHRCCCDVKSTNSFKSTAEFKVAYCHFAFSQTMDTQSKTSVKGGADEFLMLKMALNLEKSGRADPRKTAGARGADRAPP